MEVTNRFKGLDLIDRVPEEPWTEVLDIVQEEVIKTIPKKKKCKRQNGYLRAKSIYYHHHLSHPCVMRDLSSIGSTKSQPVDRQGNS